MRTNVTLNLFQGPAFLSQRVNRSGMLNQVQHDECM